MEPSEHSPAATPSASPLIPHGFVMDEATKAKVATITARLCEPFAESEIEWVVKDDDILAERGGTYRARCFAYVNARAVQERLDAVFGSLYWKSNLVPAAFGGPGRQGFICELSIMLPGIGWLTKSDAAELTSKEPVKGGASGALKRAAVLFGIGRYLYSLGESYADFREDGTRTVRFENKVLRWNPPLLPSWALPERDRARRETELRQRAWRAYSAWVTSGGKFGEEPPASVAPSAPVAAPVTAPIVQTSPGAQPETSPTEAPPVATTEPESRRGTGMSLALLSEVRDLLGPDSDLVLAYLKQKKYLPSGATDISQLPVRIAEKIVNMKDQVKPKMETLTAISKVIHGRHDQADVIFLGRGLIKAGQRWFEADDKGLDYAVKNTAAFKKALDTAAAKAKAASQQQQTAA